MTILPFGLADNHRSTLDCFQLVSSLGLTDDPFRQSEVRSTSTVDPVVQKLYRKLQSSVHRLPRRSAKL
ncbi:MAG: hypothetical protein DWH99_03705 [Planctomycetota bacterium]|nr:MAG: hypothetical protein DWH99_03705 [Planctomycetota bacterium]